MLLQTMLSLQNPSHGIAAEELDGEERRGGKLSHWDRGVEVIMESGLEAREERARAPQDSIVVKLRERGVEVMTEYGVEERQEEEKRALVVQSFLELVPGPGRCLSVLQLSNSGLRELQGLEELQGVMKVS